MKRKSVLLAGIGAWMTAALGAPKEAVAQTGNAPQATSLLSGDPLAFKGYGLGPGKSLLSVVPVEGRMFPAALRLATVTEPPRYYDYGATSPLISSVHKGDVLWVSLWARRITSRKESGEAQFEIALLQKVGAREVRPLEKRVSVGPIWTRFDLPFAVKNDSDIGEAHLALRYGYGVQSIEVGGIRLLNYGPGVKIADLPRTMLRYDGWASDAPWRKAADTRIEKYRKGDLIVRVVGAAGNPVPDASVQIRMKRHSFAWGAAIDELRLLDDKNPDNVRYQQVLEKYFNKVVFDNDMKWGRWDQPKYRSGVLASLPWLKERGFAVRGHVMVWPGWTHLPAFVAASKNDPAALKRLVSEHIKDQTSALSGRLAEWDVINETFSNHDLLDILGRDIMVDWFREAKAGAPDTKLFYNDFTMFQPGIGSQYFYDTVKFLKDKGAPIDAIGEQGHFASSPPGIPDVLATLDKFSKIGLPIQISEFDIDTDDEGLQTDFTRDFMTAVFSHPSVIGVVQWGFWSKAHWLPRAALWGDDWKLRPNGQVWVDLTTRTWWTNADGRTTAGGVYTTRGFYGDYEVTVTHGTTVKPVTFSLSPVNSVLTVTLESNK